MEWMKDLLVVLGRIVTIFPIVLIMALYMGKRSIGELPVFDFLVIIAIGAVVGADIADPKIEHLPTFAAIVFIGLLQRFVSYLAIKFRTFGKWITFEPSVVIHNGSLLKHNLRKERYSIDNILQMLREKNIFQLDEVELAVLEANGKLSVYKKPIKSIPTIEDLGLATKGKELEFSLILDGIVCEEVLNYIRKDHDWLESQLQAKGVTTKDIFYASVNELGEIRISQPLSSPVPPVRH